MCSILAIISQSADTRMIRRFAVLIFAFSRALKNDRKDYTEFAFRAQLMIKIPEQLPDQDVVSTTDKVEPTTLTTKIDEETTKKENESVSTTKDVEKDDYFFIFAQKPQPVLGWPIQWKTIEMSFVMSAEGSFVDDRKIAVPPSESHYGYTGGSVWSFVNGEVYIFGGLDDPKSEELLENTKKISKLENCEIRRTNKQLKFAVSGISSIMEIQKKEGSTGEQKLSFIFPLIFSSDLWPSKSVRRV